MGVAGMDAPATYGIDLEVFFKHKGRREWLCSAHPAPETNFKKELKC
jgi:hypothetical protein